MVSESESTENNNVTTNTEGNAISNAIRQLFYNKHYNLVIEQTTKILENLQQRRVNVMLHQKAAQHT